MKMRPTTGTLASETIGDLAKEIKNELDFLDIVEKDIHAVLDGVRAEKLRIKKVLGHVRALDDE